MRSSHSLVPTAFMAKENINQKDDMSDVNLFFDEETTKSVKNDSSDPNIKIIKINNESQ